MEPKRLIIFLGFQAPTLSSESFAITEARISWTTQESKTTKKAKKEEQVFSMVDPHTLTITLESCP